MRNMNRIKWFFFLVILVSPIFTGAICADLGKQIADKATINIEVSENIDLPEIDADQLTKSKNVPNENGKLPQGAPEVAIPIELGKDVDLASNPKVAEHKSKLSYVKVDKVSLKALTNSLNFDLPVLEVKMAEKGSDNPQVVGTIQSIKAGEVNVERVLQQTAAQKAAMEALFLKFAFNVGMKATFTVKPGQEVPKGKAKLQLGLKLQFGVSPFK